MRGLICEFCGSSARFGKGVTGWFVMRRLQAPDENAQRTMQFGPFEIPIPGTPVEVEGDPAMKQEPIPLDTDEGVHLCTQGCVIGWLTNDMRSLVEIPAAPEPS